MSVRAAAAPDGSCFSRAVNYTKSWISPRTRDHLDSWSTTAPATLALGSFCYIVAVGDQSELRPYLTPILYVGLAATLILDQLYYKRFRLSRIDKELRKAVENSNNEGPSMLVLKTTDDPAHAFDTHQTVDHLQKIGKTHSILYQEIESEKQLTALGRERTNWADRIEILAHGNTNGVALADRVVITKYDRDLLRTINKVLKTNGTIVLDACRTAKGENNFAQALSECCPTATVYASSEDVNSVKGLQYDENHIPHFNNGKFMRRKDTTSVYRDGKLISGTLHY